jgi:3-methylfumaryl-CoA hydratase
MTANDSDLQQWIGTRISAQDTLHSTPATAMAATLDRPCPAIGNSLPPLWHWLYFLPMTPSAELAPDGHAARGSFLPPIALPRRLWAGSRIQFHHALVLGDAVRRDSHIANIISKHGRSGELAIVTVVHEIHGSRGIAIREEQDIVYREAPRANALHSEPPGAPTEAQWSHPRTADPVLLFRYSALTFNAHRIHYDHPYATGVEAYPGLVVHGPLILTLLIDSLLQEHPAAVIRTLQMRALRPLFEGQRFLLQGCLSADNNRAQLWSLDDQGAMTMQVDVSLAE